MLYYLVSVYFSLHLYSLYIVYYLTYPERHTLDVPPYLHQKQQENTSDLCYTGFDAWLLYNKTSNFYSHV